MDDVIVIGIDGPSRCGKSTLAEMLEVGLAAKVVRGDNHWVHPLPFHPQFGQNWEIPEAVDWCTFLASISKAHNDLRRAPNTRGGAKYLVLEGFLLFESQEIVRMCQKRIVFSASKLTLKQRRMQTTRVPEQYYEQVLWPNARIHMQKVENLIREDPTGFFLLNGEENVFDNFQYSVAYITGRPLPNTVFMPLVSAQLKRCPRGIPIPNTPLSPLSNPTTYPRALATHQDLQRNFRDKVLKSQVLPPCHAPPTPSEIPDYGG